MTTDDRRQAVPVDLQELREADALTRAWDAWLESAPDDSIAEAAAGELDPSLAHFAYALPNRDRTPGPGSGFRRSLKRDLLHAYDALHSGVAPEVSPTRSTLETVLAPDHLPAVPPSRRPAARRSFRLPFRRWWPAVEFAAAMLLIAGLLTVSFGNARLAQFFRDEAEPTSIAGYAGQPTELPATSTAEPSPTTKPTPPPAPVPTEVAVVEPEAGNSAAAADQFPDPASGTVTSGWQHNVSDYLPDAYLVVQHIVAAPNTVFIIGTADDGLWHLAAVDAATGRLRWATQLPEDNATEPVVDAQGNVYVLSSTSHLSAWNESSDVAFLDTDTSGEVPGAPPVLFDGLVYIASGSGPTPPSITAAGGFIFVVGSSTDTVTAIEPSTGTFVFSQTLGGETTELIENAVWQLDPKGGSSIDVRQSQLGPIQNVRAISDDTIVTDTSSDGGITFDYFSFWSTVDLTESPFSHGGISATPLPEASTDSFSFMRGNDDGSFEIESVPLSEPEAATAGGSSYFPPPTNPVVVHAFGGSVYVAEASNLTIYALSTDQTGGVAQDIPISADMQEVVTAFAVTKFGLFYATDLGTIGMLDSTTLNRATFDASANTSAVGTANLGTNLQPGTASSVSWPGNVETATVAESLVLTLDWQIPYDPSLLVKYAVATESTLFVVGFYPIDGGGEVFALDAVSGTVRWSQPFTGGLAADPVALDGYLYTLGDDARFTVWDEFSGDTIIDVPTTDRLTHSMPIFAGGLVYFVSDGGSGSTATGLTAAGEYLYALGGSSDYLTAVDPATGDVVYDQPLGRDIANDLANTVWQIDPAGGQVVSWLTSEYGQLLGIWTVGDGYVVTTRLSAAGTPSALTLWDTETHAQTPIDYGDSVYVGIPGPIGAFAPYIQVELPTGEVQLESIIATDTGLKTQVLTVLPLRSEGRGAQIFPVDGSLYVFDGSSLMLVTDAVHFAGVLPIASDPNQQLVRITAFADAVYYVSNIGAITRLSLSSPTEG